MYICICKQVTENQIKASIKEGAASIDDLCHDLGVASQCGQCNNCAKALLATHAAPPVTRFSAPKQRSQNIPIEIFC